VQQVNVTVTNGAEQLSTAKGKTTRQINITNTKRCTQILILLFPHPNPPPQARHHHHHKVIMPKKTAPATADIVLTHEGVPGSAETVNVKQDSPMQQVRDEEERRLHE